MSYLGKPHNRIQDNQVQLYTSIRDLNFYLLVGCKTIHISNTVEKLLWTNCIVTSLYRKNPHVRIQNNQVQLYIFFIHLWVIKKTQHILVIQLNNYYERTVSLLRGMQGNHISEFMKTRYSRIQELEI